MDLSAVSISPPVLFFVLGAVAALVKSNLRVPRAVTKLMSLYLLWAIGFTGGVKIAQSGVTQDAVVATTLGIALSAVMPFGVFALLRRKIGIHNAAAAAACFGSVSAVTFLTASSMLDAAGVAYGGHMVAVMALMESPAIVVSIILLRRAERAEAAAGSDQAKQPMGWGHLLHEAFLNGPVLLLLGSLVIFNGVLVFFLLDLGILAARRFRNFIERGWSLVVFGLVFPPVGAAIALVLAKVCGLSVGDATLLAVLSASASYIAVPAAVRIAIPKAEPSIYIGLALAVTFPFNIVVGIPLYLAAAKLLIGE
jgi:hypothetical protein